MKLRKLKSQHYRKNTMAGTPIWKFNLEVHQGLINAQGGGYSRIKDTLEAHLGRALHKTEKHKIEVLCGGCDRGRADFVRQIKHKIKHKLAQHFKHIESEIERYLLCGHGGYLHIRNGLQETLGRRLNVMEKDRITVLSQKSREQKFPARISVEINAASLKHIASMSYKARMGLICLVLASLGLVSVR